MVRFAFAQSGPRKVDRGHEAIETQKNNNGPVWTRRYSIAVDYKYYGGRIICMLNSRNRMQTYIMFRAFTLLINYAQSLIEQSKSPGHPIVVWFRL